MCVMNQETHFCAFCIRFGNGFRFEWVLVGACVCNTNVVSLVETRDDGRVSTVCVCVRMIYECTSHACAYSQRADLKWNWTNGTGKASCLGTADLQRRSALKAIILYSEISFRIHIRLAYVLVPSVQHFRAMSPPSSLSGDLVHVSSIRATSLPRHTHTHKHTRDVSKNAYDHTTHSHPSS